VLAIPASFSRQQLQDLRAKLQEQHSETGVPVELLIVSGSRRTRLPTNFKVAPTEPQLALLRQLIGSSGVRIR
jgi:hypothetical protein